ncbi:MAG: succinylglutamate desuccinylase/aspartoacylase family protein [Pirellulaceae bacterium]|nr:succinylglutamate desuccinylase/aspartoacylase family protein [Pirellulaceae bacterium]
MNHKKESLISCDIDFNRDGKQFGTLAVPQSTNSAGWANYFIPICVIKNGEGPTAVMSGGNHGDEFEGPTTLMNLARTLEPDDIQGRVILIPMLNRPAVLAGTRLSPIDGVNMNRAFPGKPNDSITGMIAHYVGQEIIPLADLVVDIHSGGSSMLFLPSVNMHRVENEQQMERMLAAGKAWGAPYVLLYRDVAGEGLLPSYAEGLGKVTLGTELGSKSQFGAPILNIAMTGVRNVLVWAEILKAVPQSNVNSTPIVIEADDPRDYIMAPVSGLFEPFVELGDAVETGQVVGQIHDLETIQRTPTSVVAATHGLVTARRAIPLTTQGECVVTLARVLDP